MDPPDEDATNKKRAAMVKRLNKRRSNLQNKWDHRRSQNTVADLEMTERTFFEQQSFAQPPPMNITDISMINPSDTFVVTTPSRRFGPVTSTPFHPRKKPSFSSPRLRIDEAHESYVDIMERQFNALSGWCNTLLNMCNRFEDGIVDLGKTKQDAAKKLQELLTSQCKDTSGTDLKKFRYKETFCQQEFEASKQKAKELFKSSPIPGKIVSMIQADCVLIRDNMTVFSDIILKSTLLHVFLSFHPVWLHLGMEIVFDTEINITDGSSFLATMTNFINTRLFADPVILKNKKNVHGTVKLLLSDQGRQALHRHFLIKTCQFFFCVEMCKTADVIRSDPRMFARRSQFKSLQDVFGEFSREALSSASLRLNKAFTKIGFEPKYVQNYFDDLEYKVETFADLTDGVHLGKLVEVANKLGRGTVMSRLRNPRGDRLSKISNVMTVLQIAASKGIDVKHIDPDQIVRCNHEIILQVLWKIIGVYVVSSGGTADAAIQELQELHDRIDLEKARENAATRLQTYIRRFLAQKSYQSMLEQLRRRSAVVLQSVIRQFLAQAAFRHHLNSLKLVKAQSYVRRFLASQKFKDVFRARADALEAVKCIQVHVRRFLAVRSYEHRRLENRSAIILQSVSRHFLAAIAVQRRVVFTKSVVKAQIYARRSLARKKFKEFEHEKMVRLEATIRIQAQVRRFLAQKMYQSMLKQLRDRSAIVLQSLVRNYLAQVEFSRRANYAKNVVTVQSCIRRFLACKKFGEVGQVEVHQLEDSISEMSAMTPPPARSVPRIPMNVAQSTPIILKTLRRLRQSISHLQTSNAAHERTLNELKTVRIVSLEDQTLAAITIQRVWRGYWTRKNLQAEMAQLEAADIQYREEMKINEIPFGRGGRSAFVKLEESVEMLFDERLYRTKVAAIVINRLIRLTTQLCHHFITKCDGVQAVIDRMDAADRSPGEEEIVSQLVNIMQYLVEQTQTDAELRFTVLRHHESCRKILFHVLNAFHNNADIVTKSASSLIMIKNLSPDVDSPNSKSQAKYYITAAFRRYARLPVNDPKRLAARSLEASYQ